MAKHKYGAFREEVDGIKFDSRKEAKRYRDLKLMAMSGSITELCVHRRFTLFDGDKPIKQFSKRFCKNGRIIQYEADFDYKNERGVWVVEDTKGMDLPLGKLKRAIFESNHGMRIQVI